MANGSVDTVSIVNALRAIVTELQHIRNSLQQIAAKR
jgi:hypothetical protein